MILSSSRSNGKSRLSASVLDEVGVPHTLVSAQPSSAPSCLRLSGYANNYRQFPRLVVFQGRSFVRQLGPFYLPVKATFHELSLFFDTIAPIYDEVTILQANGIVMTKLLEHALAHAPAKPKILDFGVGTAHIANVLEEGFALAPSNVIGVDISEKMVGLARARGIDAHKIDGVTLPFPSNYFDAVLATYVIHYLPDLRPFYEICRVLKSGGCFAFNLRWPHPATERCYRQMLTSLGLSRLKRETGILPPCQELGSTYGLDGFRYSLIVARK